MTEKRLSETMSDATYAVCQAQETLNDAITKAINTHFEAGIQVEQERIIKLLDESLYWSYDIGISDKESGCQIDVEQLIYLIKGEQK